MPRIQKRDEKAAGTHSSCINCGELVFDRVLKQCPRCEGRVTYFSDEDLGFLTRVAERPVLISDAEKTE